MRNKSSNLNQIANINPVIFILFISLISCQNNTFKRDFSNGEIIKFGREILQSDLLRIDTTGQFARELKITTVADPGLSERTESFILRIDDKTIDIKGTDEAGVLYGCMHIADMIRENHTLPLSYEYSDGPKLKWRGISIQLMKLGEYNFAITPEEFPFFYDKELWLKTFRFLLENKFNYLIFWNGHPFDYFVKFDRFPEAQAGLSDEIIQKNNKMLKWLISEGRKRNIRIFFEFYNIHTSVYFQKAHALPKQISKPTPLLEDYTAYSISKFVSEFPEVGLFVTPGEGIAIQYTDTWINNIIFKAVKQTGKTPPVFIRAWSFELPHAKKLLHNYPDLSFVRKFNVEMITGREPDPENALWANLNGNFITNIHLAANLEPFRWNPPAYIQNIVRNNIRTGATGIHLHPRKAWRWPYSSDKDLRQYQWHRDELWFQSWGRYAWNPYRDAKEEESYWLYQLERRFGDNQAAIHFLKSFETGADVLPAIQRLIWLGNDNHSIVTAGATLAQLQNSKGIPFISLGDTMNISQYALALKQGTEINSVTPLDFVKTRIAIAQNALNEAESGLRYTRLNRAEARRIVNDAQAIHLTVQFYYSKLLALKHRILYAAAIEPELNRRLFISSLRQSVKDFRNLIKTTQPTYESISDVPAKHPARLKTNPYHWNDVLPVFEKELEIYTSDVTRKRDKNFFQPSLPGLAGIWYSEPDFIDAEKPINTDLLSYTWNSATEGVGRHWSVHWFGYIKTPVSGKVAFVLTADRGVKVLIGDNFFITNNAVTGKNICTTAFQADSSYRFEVYYDHKSGEAGTLKLEWIWDEQPQEIVGGDFLWHSPAQEHETRLMVQLINE